MSKMRRVLLVLEDYNELLFLGTLLKKVGFDIESIRNEISLTEKMMGFSPDLVIATGDGQKINGIRVSKKVKKKGQHAKLLLLFPRQRLQQERALDTFAADGAVETPLNPRQIIASVCQMTGVGLDGVMAKFEKLPIAHEQAAPEGMQIITAKKGAPKAEHNTDVSSQMSPRAQHYFEILKGLPKGPEVTFSRQLVQKEMENNAREPAPPHWDEIEEGRKKFVEALFKKK